MFSVRQRKFTKFKVLYAGNEENRNRLYRHLFFFVFIKTIILRTESVMLITMIDQNAVQVFFLQYRE